MSGPANIALVELDLLMEAVYRIYGYDFRNYAQGSLLRRVEDFIGRHRYSSIAALIPVVIRDKRVFNALVAHLSITVTEMFRDPFFFRALREQVFPYLATYPFFKIWHAGCATGEEVYSTAILLQESGMLHRAVIYATDINEAALNVARRGIYPAGTAEKFQESYFRAGGEGELSHYFCQAYDHQKVDESLRKRITFAAHNLSVDHSFAEVEVVICRNVMIYFNSELKQRVLQVFADSLHEGGYLCLGDKESLDSVSQQHWFEESDYSHKIFRKSHKEAALA